MIPYGHQSIDEDDIDEVIKVLRSGFLTQGEVIPRFELAVADYCGAKYAVAVNSGTSALHIACLSLGLGKGDLLWTSANSFVASANCALYCGAEVDFIDIDPHSYNMDVGVLRNKLESAKKENCLPKVLIPVHFSGQSCQMKEIKSLSKKYGFYVIEDAAHALGGSYGDEKIGSCSYSDMTIFSFHPIKSITTGEGGMVVTNNEVFYRALCQFRSHGITKERSEFHDLNQGKWFYEQQKLGFNYRLTDIQAALGISQLNRLDQFILERRKRASIYNDALSGLPIQRPAYCDDDNSAWHIYVIQLKPDKINITRDELYDQLINSEIETNVHYIPIYRQPYYREIGYKYEDYPNTEQYYKNTLTLPLYPELNIKQQQFVVQKLKQILD